MLSKLFKALSRPREGISHALSNLLSKGPSVNELDKLEETLLETDMGYDTVEVITKIVSRYSGKDLKNTIRDQLIEILPFQAELKIDKKPCVIPIVGVNGSGKTTSAAKLAHMYMETGSDVTLVAADTYRAAAVDQLKIWSDRVGCRLICNENSGEPTSVLFDGLESADAHGSDIVLVDTAGRLHTSSNLMSELEKMYRVMDNRFSQFSVNPLIALDACIGQNSLVQAKEFHQQHPLNGAILTKLDGTARGGIVFPLFRELGIPVKFIGVGESLEDLALFDPKAYVDSLLGIENKLSDNER